MRHAAEGVTDGHYADAKLIDLRGALKRLPALPLDGNLETNAHRATGTHGDADTTPAAPRLFPRQLQRETQRPGAASRAAGGPSGPNGDACNPLPAAEQCEHARSDASRGGKAGDGIRTHDVQLGIRCSARNCLRRRHLQRVFRPKRRVTGGSQVTDNSITSHHQVTTDQVCDQLVEPRRARDPALPPCFHRPREHCIDRLDVHLHRRKSQDDGCVGRQAASETSGEGPADLRHQAARSPDAGGVPPATRASHSGEA